MLDEHYKTKTNITRKFTINGTKVLLMVRLGKVNVKGTALSRLVIKQIDKEILYLNPIDCSQYKQYKGKTLREFIIQIAEEGLIKL